MPIQAQIDGIGTLEFPDGTSPDVVHATVQKVVMQHNAPKPLSGAATPVPAPLRGGPDPEYKPFFSGDEARDELSGLGKSVTPIVAGAGNLLGKVPLIGKGVIDPQKVHDLEEYSKPANKGETFGKVSGSIAQALPALLSGGEFAGGLYDELAPLGNAFIKGPVADAAGALGKVAVPAAKHALKGIGTGATLYGLEKLRDLF
jgi:hypothetical protein